MIRALLIFTLILNVGIIMNYAYAKQPALDVAMGSGKPKIEDPNLMVDTVFDGLELPTSIAFLNQSDILVLEKDKGTVQRIINGNMLPEPLLDVDVANKNERGMLGIAVMHLGNYPTYVYLYYTESRKEGSDDCPKSYYCEPGNEPLGNRLYRYELANDKLVNAKLILDLPATPGPSHNGGSLIIGPDGNLYLSIGDVRLSNREINNQSIQNISSVDGRGGILRVTENGKAVNDGLLGNRYPINLYFAYGIRNSFGIDFDPLTGSLWDTENGPDYGDEINLVEPGSNSGWDEVQGIWPVNYEAVPTKIDKTLLHPDHLLDFGRKSNYSLPELTWADTVGPTAIKFFKSDKLGKQYENDMFIGDVRYGNIYHFDLDDQRKGLLLGGTVDDKIIYSDIENEKIIFGEGFGGISDLEIGPDGYLYVVSIGQGKIYKLMPVD